MHQHPKKLIAGNWKMNGLKAEGLALATDLAGRLRAADRGVFDMLLCPPFTLLSEVARAIAGSGLLLGGQTCHEQKTGAFTGEISAEMLKDAGCSHVVLGHSERRQLFGETSLQVRRKAAAAHEAGLVTIICVGETEEQRAAGQHLPVVAGQLRESLPEASVSSSAASSLAPSLANPLTTVIAYEPVWAIGTGKNASTADILEMHAFIRETLGGLMPDSGKIKILYGGSVKPDNAPAILTAKNVDGVLVGGASLKAADFWAIAQACA